MGRMITQDSCATVAVTFVQCVRNFTFQLEDSPEKKVLVLGLEGAGKTCILAALGKQDHPHKSKPTEGFNVMCVQTDKYSLNIWESKDSSLNCS